MLSSIICFMTRHDPERAGALGGWRCTRCNKAGASLDDYEGFYGQGYVSPMRPRFQRANGNRPQSISRYVNKEGEAL